MNESDNEQSMRECVVKLLEKKGYKVTDKASGRGVPRFSRLMIEHGKETLSCTVKTTDGGRISYTRNPDGTYKVLSDADRVIHAYRTGADRKHVRISMFNKSTVVDAFEANHRSKVAHGMEYLPSWVNPELENGWRLAGSGFQDQALWSETVPITPGSELEVPPEVPPKAADRLQLDQAMGIMDRIKIMLSEHMGVQPELIEVDVRVRL